MNDRHFIKYWTAKILNAINFVFKGLVLVFMGIITIPYLIIMALAIGAFTALVSMNEKAEKWFGLKRTNILIEIERTKNLEEIEDLRQELEDI